MVENLNTKQMMRHPCWEHIIDHRRQSAQNDSVVMLEYPYPQNCASKTMLSPNMHIVQNCACRAGQVEVTVLETVLTEQQNVKERVNYA